MFELEIGTWQLSKSLHYINAATQVVFRCDPVSLLLHPCNILQYKFFSHRLSTPLLLAIKRTMDVVEGATSIYYSEHLS